MTDKPKILVVDDENLIVTMIKDFLEANNYQVITAIDGEEGLHKARAEKPNLIILDVMMPKLDGYKVARLLKFDVRYKHIPIIMLTARAGTVDRDVSLKSGADAYLVKPLDLAILLAKIEALLPKA
ncbi:MAG: response regulator [candidate division NC10 bacterium]|nr:response regulator [candidate division NC10 bacterium]